MIVTYTQSFTVHDPEALAAAARAHVDAKGMSAASFYEDGGEVDASVCIAMLMDQGSLPGCSASNHEVNQE